MLLLSANGGRSELIIADRFGSWFGFARVGTGCMIYAIYIALILGAAALLMMLPGSSASTQAATATKAGLWRKLGALLGCATLGGLWLALYPLLPDDHGINGGGWAMAYFYVFASLGIFSAVKVITHPKPVYCALWFVMVVLSSAGVFLLLQAEFMAFAMVIIYGGAILVTYVFVLMLASQNPNEQDSDQAGDATSNVTASADATNPTGPRNTLEPAAACAAGFLLLAVLLSVHFQPMEPNRAGYAVGWNDEKISTQILTQRPQVRLQGTAADQPEGATQPVAATDVNHRVTNVERVGLDLFRSHPLGLELAGVILLVSLVGAVVIARMKVETEKD